MRNSERAASSSPTAYQLLCISLLFRNSHKPCPSCGPLLFLVCISSLAPSPPPPPFTPPLSSQHFFAQRDVLLMKMKELLIFSSIPHPPLRRILLRPPISFASIYPICCFLLSYPGLSFLSPPALPFPATSSSTTRLAPNDPASFFPLPSTGSPRPFFPLALLRGPLPLSAPRAVTSTIARGGNITFRITVQPPGNATTSYA